MAEYLHELVMTNPRNGNRDAYYFNHSLLDELANILVFWIPAGYTDFWINGVPVECPSSDHKEAE